MNFSDTNPHRHRTGTSTELSWHVVVILVSLLVTATSSVGHEIPNTEGQKAELVRVEQKRGNFHMKQGLSYHYDPHNRREPFLPIVIQKKRNHSAFSNELSETEKPKWKLLGIIWGVQGYYASIQNADGKRYIVTSGTVIPSEGLIVKRINKAELEMDFLDERKITTHLEGSLQLIVSF